MLALAETGERLGDVGGERIVCSSNA